MFGMLTFFRAESRFAMEEQNNSVLENLKGFHHYGMLLEPKF